MILSSEAMASINSRGVKIMPYPFKRVIVLILGYFLSSSDKSLVYLTINCHTSLLRSMPAERIDELSICSGVESKAARSMVSIF